MLIQGSFITVTYKKIEGIKRAYYNNDSILKDYFNEASVLAVPDDAPIEIPRIIIKTLNEHAQLKISPIAATFEVYYNSGFEKDWDSCANYISERMSKVFQFLNILTGNNYEYVGLVSNVIYDEIKKDGAKKIATSLLNTKKINDIFDINVKYTFVEKENLFVNIMLQNTRLFQNGVDVNTAGFFGNGENIPESIGATIDINDRYGFNKNKDYKSNVRMLDELIKSMGNVIQNKLGLLIENGEY